MKNVKADYISRQSVGNSSASGYSKTANAKSVISILASSVKCGQEIVLEADGEDEEEAINAVAQAFKESLKND